MSDLDDSNDTVLTTYFLASRFAMDYLPVHAFTGIHEEPLESRVFYLPFTLCVQYSMERLPVHLRSRCPCGKDADRGRVTDVRGGGR